MQQSIKELFNDFHNNDKNITNNQILYMKKLLNKEEIDNLLNKYNCTYLNNLKYYQVYEILKSEIFINNDTIFLLIKFFLDNQVDKIMHIFEKNNINDYNNLYNEFKNEVHNHNHSVDNYKNIFNFISKIRQKHIKYIYSMYPKLTVLNNKYKLFIKSYDVPLISTNEYEYGYQLKKNVNSDNNTNNLDNKNYDRFYYIKFYNWGSFDIDNQNFDYIDNLLNKIINLTNTYVFALYKTNNGYHVHIMNKLIEHNSNEFKYLSEILDNDIWYYNYCKIVGYKLRLSKKFDNDIISKFIKYYVPISFGKKFLCHQCLKYKKIYERLVVKFSK